MHLTVGTGRTVSWGYLMEKVNQFIHSGQMFMHFTNNLDNEVKNVRKHGLQYQVLTKNGYMCFVWK